MQTEKDLKYTCPASVTSLLTLSRQKGYLAPSSEETHRRAMVGAAESNNLLPRNIVIM